MEIKPYTGTYQRGTSISAGTFLLSHAIIIVVPGWCNIGVGIKKAVLGKGAYQGLTGAELAS